MIGKSTLFSLLLNFFEFPDRHCSRYQFECRSSQECIAIYNACDGIPQCSDGSDEAPELGCPALCKLNFIVPTIVVLESLF